MAAGVASGRGSDTNLNSVLCVFSLWIRASSTSKVLGRQCSHRIHSLVLLLPRARDALFRWLAFSELQLM